MVRKTSLAAAILVPLFLVGVFQACSPSRLFDTSTLTKAQASSGTGNGSGFEGKLIYVSYDPNGTCQDMDTSGRPMPNFQIDLSTSASVVQAELIRSNCANQIPSKLILSSELTRDEANGVLTYQGITYSRVEFPPEPVTPPSIEMLSPSMLQASPGATFQTTFQWVSLPMAKNFMVFVHIVDQNGSIIFQDDFMPSLPTSAWMGEASETRTIQVPLGTPPGLYSVLSGLYVFGDYALSARMTLSPGTQVTTDNQNKFKVGALLVQ